MVAVVRQQVGLVVLSGHRQLRLQDKVDLEATFRMVIFPLSKIDIGCYKFPHLKQHWIERSLRSAPVCKQLSKVLLVQA